MTDEMQRTTPKKIDITDMPPEQGYRIKWRPGLREVPLEPYWQHPLGVPRGPERLRK